MHIDVKETIWHRLVIDESYEAEVTKMLYEGKSYADVANFLYSKGEENTQVEYLFETTQGIEPEQNNGDNTIELIDNDGNIVWGNNGDNKFILNPDKKAVRKILKACWRNGGLCPCYPGASDIGDVNRFCPCQDFREKKACHCNLYLPKPEENEQESSIS